ncbi:MAG TPA: two-component regulator propeller domain-containing protein, partial [Candidatus Limnocylindria bacterium]|nr:two-component regulator propeller domain-containing protein [Candidatus Limnocylindria bacterium]
MRAEFASVTPTKPSTGHFVRALVCGLWIFLLRPAAGHPVAVPPASRYLIDNWEIEDGLPENSATSMGQTQDGYLWFGTFNGLVRFDGVRFKVFDPGNTPELPSPGIVNLHVDSSGRLWVSTLRGLVIRERGRWINLGNANGWKGNYVRTFAENAGVIGMTSFDWKVARADVLGHVEPLPDPPGNLDSGCFAYVDALGRVWAIKREFAGYWDGTKWQSTPITSLVAPDMRGAAAARDGGLLVLQTTGLHRVRDNRLISSVTFQHEVAGAWNLHEDREGTVWVTDIQQGLHSISKEGQFTHYTATNGMEFSSVRFVEEDREQNLWVGTSGNGLFRLKPRTFAAIGLDSGLPERLVKSIAESKSGFHYFATYGKDAVQMKDGRISPVTAGAAVSGYAQSVLVDREDRLWVGSYSTGPNDVGLYYIDRSGRHPVAQADSGGGTVNALFEDSTGRLWIGGDKAAMVRGPAGFGSVQKKGGGALAGVRAFAEEPVKKTIWAINDEGLYEYGGNEWQEFTTPGGKRFGESSGLTFDREGALWLGTAQDGLLRIKNGQIAAITHAEGLPTYFLSCMLDDGLGYWWIGCNKGVIRVAKKDLDRVADRSLTHLPFQLYNTSDGLPSSECPTGLQPTGFRDSRGHLWFATTKGAAVIDPHFPNLNITQPEVRIERLTYVDQAGISHEIDEPAAANISIPPGSRELEISYDALTFRAPEKVQLAYRLGGKSEPWIDIGNRRSVFFHTLHPGQLGLSIKAANDSGLWNDTGASIILDVRPFVWQTLWFRLLAAVGTAGAIGTAVWRVARTQFQLRLQKLEHENKLAEQQARL